MASAMRQALLYRVQMPGVGHTRQACFVQARQITSHYCRHGGAQQQHPLIGGSRRQCAHPPPPPTLLPPRTRTTVRCMASKGGGDKSWTDIAQEAGQLAT